MEERDLTEAVAARQRVDAHAVDEHLELALCNRVVAVSFLALPHDHVAGSGRDRDEAPGKALERGRRERREEPQRPEQADLDDRDVRRRIEREESPSAEEREERQDRADAED